MPSRSPITPEYLKKIGLIEKIPPPAADLPLLLRTAHGQDCISAVRADDRQVAMGGIFGAGEARGLQQGLVDSCASSIREWLRR